MEIIAYFLSKRFELWIRDKLEPVLPIPTVCFILMSESVRVVQVSLKVGYIGVLVPA